MISEEHKAKLRDNIAKARSAKKSKSETIPQEQPVDSTPATAQPLQQPAFKSVAAPKMEPANLAPINESPKRKDSIKGPLVVFPRPKDGLDRRLYQPLSNVKRWLTKEEALGMGFPWSE